MSVGDCSLINLGLEGLGFTWIRKPINGHVIMKCFDRAFCNSY